MLQKSGGKQYNKVDAVITKVLLMLTTYCIASCGAIVLSGSVLDSGATFVMGAFAVIGAITIASWYATKWNNHSWLLVGSVGALLAQATWMVPIGIVTIVQKLF